MITESTTISRPIDVVWLFLTTKENWSKWWGGGVLKVVPDWQKGGKIHWELGGHSLLIECVHEKSLGISGDLMDTYLRCVALPNSATMVEITESNPKKGVRFTDGGARQRHALKKSLQQLKRSLEGDTDVVEGKSNLGRPGAEVVEDHEPIEHTSNRIRPARPASPNWMCKKCQGPRDPLDVTCPNCGDTQFLTIISVAVVSSLLTSSLSFLASFIDAPGFRALATTVLLLLFFACLSYVIQMTIHAVAFQKPSRSVAAGYAFFALLCAHGAIGIGSGHHGLFHVQLDMGWIVLFVSIFTMAALIGVANLIRYVWKPPRAMTLIERMIRDLGNEEATVRAKSSKALYQIGEPAIDPLIESLRNGSAIARASAIDILGVIGDTRAVGPLTQALSDDNRGIRERAAKALEKMSIDARSSASALTRKF